MIDQVLEVKDGKNGLMTMKLREVSSSPRNG